MVDSTSLCCDELQLAVYLYWGMDLEHCKDYPKQLWMSHKIIPHSQSNQGNFLSTGILVPLHVHAWSNCGVSVKSSYTLSCVLIIMCSGYHATHDVYSLLLQGGAITDNIFIQLYTLQIMTIITGRL